MVCCLTIFFSYSTIYKSLHKALTAIPIAIAASVTVSIGEETSGTFIVIDFVKAEVKS